MPTSKITSKGQATIPSSIRRILGVRPSDRISFRLERGRVFIEPKRKELASLFGKYQNKSKGKVSVEDMNRAIRDKAMSSIR